MQCVDNSPLFNFSPQCHLISHLIALFGRTVVDSCSSLTASSSLRNLVVFIYLIIFSFPRRFNLSHLWHLTNIMNSSSVMCLSIYFSELKIIEFLFSIHGMKTCIKHTYISNYVNRNKKLSLPQVVERITQQSKWLLNNMLKFYKCKQIE